MIKREKTLNSVLRRVRRKVRREAGPYTQISAAQVVAWLDEELKKTSAKGRK